jgi:NADPH2:quinone reductase
VLLQGADVLVNYGTANDYDEFVATLREADLYGKYSCVFDTVGGRYAEAAFRAMAPEGRYVVFGFAAGGVEPASAFPNFPTNIMLMKGQRILGSMGSSRGPAIRCESNKLNPLVCCLSLNFL